MDKQTTSGNPTLLGLVDFLQSRIEDADSEPKISKQTLIKTANWLGINLTKANIDQLVSQPPMSDIFDPPEPNSDVLWFKGSDHSNTAMPVNQAQDIVAGMAKRANPLA